MEPSPEPQEQPVYPQPYQQYPAPYPYYYPPPPKKKEDRTILILVVALIVIFVVVPVVLSAILYWWVMDLAPEPPDWNVPTGTWGQRSIVSPTEVTIDFGRIVPESRPVEFEIILTRNLSRDGRYIFVTNWDDDLIHISGIDHGTLTYRDVLDNQYVDSGDQIRMTGLTPNSDYTIRLIWGRTGDVITSTTFSTPR